VTVLDEILSSGIFYFVTGGFLHFEGKRATW